MTTLHERRPLPRALALVVALGALASAVTGTTASAAERGTSRPLVVRGQDTVADGPCAAGVCRLSLTGGRYHGAPVGRGAYTGSLELRIAAAFRNGEGGVCAPIRGDLTLGAGTADRLVLAVSGASCQDGAGPVTSASFTGLARFTVKRGTGAFAKVRGAGLATFAEDAADRERMTLIGRIRR